MDPAAAKLIGAGLATISLAGVGVGIGQIFGSFVQGALRNPAAAPKVFGNVLLGFARNGVGFLRLFAPSGVPVFLLPLICVIEFISYLTRPISLSIRLFANMMAGHTMLKVFAGFVVSLGFLAGWAPLAFVVALYGLELLIAFLQAYVFAILACIYLNDALNLHH